MFGEIYQFLIFSWWYLTNNNFCKFYYESEETISGISINTSSISGEMIKKDYGDFILIGNKKYLVLLKPDIDIVNFIENCKEIDEIFGIMVLRYFKKGNEKNNYKNIFFDEIKDKKINQNDNVFFKEDDFFLNVNINELQAYFGAENLAKKLKKNIKKDNSENKKYFSKMNEIIQKLSSKKYKFSIFILNYLQSEIFYNMPSKITCQIITFYGVEKIISFIFYILIFAMIFSIFLMFKIWINSRSRSPLVTPPELDDCKLINFENIENKIFKICIICMEEFKQKSLCRILFCDHYFHKNCIDPWLINQSARCPYCRRIVKINIV